MRGLYLLRRGDISTKEKAQPVIPLKGKAARAENFLSKMNEDSADFLVVLMDARRTWGFPVH
ncbi:MAG: hypothetical protein PF443_11825 [Allgaiera sp.]|nr:hypothetical protein [Allgaiera sp.]